MKVTATHPSATEAVLTVIADATELATIKAHVLEHLAPKVKLQGFRDGKAPMSLVEKNVDPSTLQTEFLEHAINDLYPDAVRQSGIRPVDTPKIELKKFVPFTTLEFQANVPVVSEIKLPDYKKIKKSRTEAKITDKDIDDIIVALQKRAAQKKDAGRAAKAGDEVSIDFKGVNEKDEDVKGADGKDYPLALGSDTFIPGFEENLIGLKAGDKKTFALTFPKDYGVKALANRKITFSVTVNKVQEVILPGVDDAFAASVGPVKTVTELKADIKKELSIERQREADRNYESELLQEITAKSKFSLPEAIIDDQAERIFKEVQQNVTYRGQTIQEFLEAEGKTEDEYKKVDLRPQAEERVRASLVLAEIADREKIEVTPEELEIRIQVLKGQYQDEKMQVELDKPDNRRDLASRMLSEKTMAVLSNYATE